MTTVDARPDTALEEALDATATEALVERLFDATVGTLELYAVHVGTQLGLYRLLADGAARTVGEIAAEAGIDERYACEWLEQQAVAGFLTIDDPSAPAGARRYTLPAAHAAVLADPTDPSHVAPFASMVVGIGGAVPEVVEAYRTGAGVPYPHYGAAFRDGQGGINRPAFTHDLTGSWIPVMTDVHERLSAGGARVADVGCGQGWSTIALSAAYPNAAIEGFDSDEASVNDARANAGTASGSGSHATFHLADGSAVAQYGAYDLICVLEALHDLARPAETLAALRAGLKPGGVVLVVDERVADTFTAPGDPVERAMYGWSVTHCLPASRAEQPSAALGTVLRAATVQELAATAGFTRADVLPIANDFFRFYRLEA